MIDQSIRLGTIRGIEIGLHYSWLIIFFLITFSLTARFSAEHPHWTAMEHYGIALVTSLLFFCSILLHELAHSFVALAKRIPVRSITLFVFGGVAQISREADRPMTEFQIAIAGPLASFGLALAFGTVAALVSLEHISTLTGWLASINFLLAAFNLLPGFPLDGGRILRAVVWGITGNMARATRIAGRSGKFLATAFMTGGIFIGFTVNWFSGLWLAFIGWFLFNAAQGSVMQLTVQSLLQGLRVRDIMGQDCSTVSPRMSIEDLVEQEILPSGRRYFPVSSNGRLEGLVTLHQIKTVPRERWATTLLSEAMTPFRNLRIVTDETPVLEALQIMEREDINQIPVTKKDQLVGMLTREHVLRVLAANMELGRETVPSKAL